MSVTTTLNDSQEDELDRVFTALSNRTRREILKRLAASSATVQELSKPFNLSLPAISRHLKVLRQAGLVQRESHAQFRICTFDPSPLEAVNEWSSTCQQTWNERLDRMDDYLDAFHK